MKHFQERAPEQTDPRGAFITTYSGRKFYPGSPNVEDIPIGEIAHALSMNCRFNGHVDSFYSVAEHSVYVSRNVPAEDALWGLLHDITEAFVPDVPRPLKPFLKGFKELEHSIMRNACKVFGLSLEEPASVLEVDKNIVALEARMLFPNYPDWTDAYDVSGISLPSPIGRTPTRARTMFLDRFAELTSRTPCFYG